MLLEAWHGVSWDRGCMEVQQQSVESVAKAWCPAMLGRQMRRCLAGC